MIASLQLFLAVSAMTLAGLPGRPNPPNTTLFTRSFGTQGQSLAVIRGPDREPSLLKDLDKSGLSEQAGVVYEVRVELQTPNQPPVILGSRLRIENHFTPVDRGVVILDCLIGPDRVVIASAEGHDLMVWQIGINPFVVANHFPYALNGWQLGAAANRLEQNMIDVKLGRSEDGRLTAEVTISVRPRHISTRDLSRPI